MGNHAVTLKVTPSLRIGLHDYLASAIHHCDRDGCLIHVQPNILLPFMRVLLS